MKEVDARTQTGDRCRIGGRSSALTNGRLRIAKAKRIERAQYGAFVVGATSGGIEIVDAQQADTGARIEQASDGSKQRSEVQEPRRGGGETTDVWSRQTQR